MKVIFLDIDGVINNWTDLDILFEECEDSSIYSSIDGFSKKSIDVVKKMENELGAKIVLCSTWRKDEHIDEVKKVFNIFDRTPVLTGKTYRDHLFKYSEYIPRHIEIQSWLDDHENVTNFVILDDDPDASNEILKPHHLLIHDEFGLDETDLPLIREAMSLERSI